MGDDAMMRPVREPMTIAQLKRSMDSRFKRVDKRFDRVDRRFERRFERIETELRALGQEMGKRSDETRGYFEKTRRHFDVVAESLHDDFRLFAEAIRADSERLDDHEVRLRRLERPRVS
jgi:hypothetical protein